MAISMNTVHYSTLPSVSLNGFLFKTGSMARVVTDRKGREGGWNLKPTNSYTKHRIGYSVREFILLMNLPVEFSRRWCTLNDGVFSYYESDRNSTPNGALKTSEIVCLAVDMPKKHGYAPKTHRLILFYSCFSPSASFILYSQVQPYLWSLFWTSLSLWHWWPRKSQGVGKLYS